jgi:ketosteroid isomerase-like protein
MQFGFLETADMSNLEENKQICRDFLGYITNVDVPSAVDCVTDDIEWWVQGEWPNGNYHHGKPAFLALFDNLKDLLDGPLSVEFGAFTAEADRVAVEMRSLAQLRNGKTYKNTYHYLFTIRDGRIAKGREYLDTKHLFETIF